MQININQDFKLDREGVHKSWPTNQELFRNYVSFGVQSAHKEGLKSDDRRLWDNIMNKFDDAIESKSDTVDLNAVQIVFLKNSFEKATIPVNEVKLFSIVENEILKLSE